MKKLFLIVLIAIPISAIGQDDLFNQKYPSLQKDRNQQLFNYLETDKAHEMNLDVTMPNYEPRKKVNEKIELNLPPIEIYQGPKVDYRVKELHFPFVNDYHYGAQYGVGQNGFLVTNSYQNTYPTLGRVRSVSAQLGYQPVEWLNVSGGPYASKYELYNTLDNNYGVGGKVQFKLNDRIRINGYGQYSSYNKDGWIPPGLADMYPSTHFGSTLEIRISDTFGLEGGMMRQFSPVTGKWSNKPYLAPVFYEKKKKPRKATAADTW